MAETGVCRLAGHKGVITQLAFMYEHNIIVSSSKDTFVKFWDLDTEHNFRTLVGHGSEVWGLTLVKNDEYLITGSNDRELRVWKISFVEGDDKNIVNRMEILNVDSENDVNDAVRISFLYLFFFYYLCNIDESDKKENLVLIEISVAM